jgi:hypothetical protein
MTREIETFALVTAAFILGLLIGSANPEPIIAFTANIGRIIFQ